MSMESAKSFVSKIIGSEQLQIQVGQAITGKTEQAAAEAFVALGKSQGFDFSSSDAMAVRDLAIQQGSGEMSAAELSGVSGGAMLYETKPGIPTPLPGGGKTGTATVGGGAINPINFRVPSISSY
jgi:predicted ribosomally synthesized peptide with nif11-like leader